MSSGSESGSESESWVVMEVLLFEPSGNAIVVEPVAVDGGDDGLIGVPAVDVTSNEPESMHYRELTHCPQLCSSPPSPRSPPCL